MSKIIFLSNPSVVYEGELSKVNENVIRLEFEENIPDSDLLLSGLNIINEHNGRPMAERIGYDTIYRTYEENPLMVELSNNSSVWVKPKYNIKFVSHDAILEGEKNQLSDSFENLNIPNVKTEKGFEFVGWTPKIPEEGDIENDMTFYAIVKDKKVYFNCSGGGTLKGEVKQIVDNYNELVVPIPIAEDNYKFIGWLPEIPTEGEISTTCFCAVFENNIPDRLRFVENDLTDTQLGLVENFDFTMSTAEEVTDLQLAMVELYNMFLLQIAE